MFVCASFDSHTPGTHTHTHTGHTHTHTHRAHTHTHTHTHTLNTPTPPTPTHTLAVTLDIYHGGGGHVSMSQHIERKKPLKRERRRPYSESLLGTRKTFLIFPFFFFGSRNHFERANKTIREADSLAAFLRRLKTHLFCE